MGALDDLGVCCLTVVSIQADPHPALLSVMPDGLLRRGEAAALCWDDLTIEDDGSVRLTISE